LEPGTEEETKAEVVEEELEESEESIEDIEMET